MRFGESGDRLMEQLLEDIDDRASLLERLFLAPKPASGRRCREMSRYIAKAAIRGANMIVTRGRGDA